MRLDKGEGNKRGWNETGQRRGKQEVGMRLDKGEGNKRGWYETGQRRGKQKRLV